MSRAEEFLVTYQNDPELQSRLISAGTSEEAKRVVTEAGFGDVSSADLQAIVSGPSDSDELSDDQLAVASGAGAVGGGIVANWPDPLPDW